MMLRFILALGTFVTALIALDVLGVFYGGLSPPAALLFTTTLIIGFVAAYMLVARLATGAFAAMTTNYGQLTLVAKRGRPAESMSETAADYQQKTSNAGYFRRSEVVLALPARFRPMAVPSAA